MKNTITAIEKIIENNDIRSFMPNKPKKEVIWILAWNTRITATIFWIKNFNVALISTKSSIAPRINNRPTQKISKKYSWGILLLPNSSKMKYAWEKIKPIKMANPPNLGTALLWIWRPPFSAKSLFLIASFINKGTQRLDIENDKVTIIIGFKEFFKKDNSESSDKNKIISEKFIFFNQI